MADDLESATKQEEQAILALPAVYANKFYFSIVNNNVCRLTLAEQGGGQGSNIALRGAYILTLRDAIELKRLLTHKLDELQTGNEDQNVAG